jgi:hypothetical protein
MKSRIKLKTHRMLYKEFYSELGKLLYAIADIDQVITQKEKIKLQEMVKKELAPKENHTDEYGTNAALYAEMEFDFLDEEIIDSESAFNSFIDFVEEHQSAFDEKLKNICMHLAIELANAYYGTNKKEKILIETLKRKIKNIEIKKRKNHL